MGRTPRETLSQSCFSKFGCSGGATHPRLDPSGVKFGDNPVNIGMALDNYSNLNLEMELDP
jgi:hypothetical protein